jgi:hypothetical protein
LVAENLRGIKKNNFIFSLKIFGPRRRAQRRIRRRRAILLLSGLYFDMLRKISIFGEAGDGGEFWFSSVAFKNIFSAISALSAVKTKS